MKEQHAVSASSFLFFFVVGACSWRFLEEEQVLSRLDRFAILRFKQQEFRTAHGATGDWYLGRPTTAIPQQGERVIKARGTTISPCFYGEIAMRVG